MQAFVCCFQERLLLKTPCSVWEWFGINKATQVEGLQMGFTILVKYSQNSSCILFHCRMSLSLMAPCQSTVKPKVIKRYLLSLHPIPKMMIPGHCAAHKWSSHPNRRTSLLPALAMESGNKRAIVKYSKQWLSTSRKIPLGHASWNMRNNCKRKLTEALPIKTLRKLQASSSFAPWRRARHRSLCRNIQKLCVLWTRNHFRWCWSYHRCISQQIRDPGSWKGQALYYPWWELWKGSPRQRQRLHRSIHKLQKILQITCFSAKLQKYCPHNSFAIWYQDLSNVFVGSLYFSVPFILVYNECNAHGICHKNLIIYTRLTTMGAGVSRLSSSATVWVLHRWFRSDWSPSKMAVYVCWDNSECL